MNSKNNVLTGLAALGLLTLTAMTTHADDKERPQAASRLNRFPRINRLRSAWRPERRERAAGPIGGFQII